MEQFTNGQYVQVKDQRNDWTRGLQGVIVKAGYDENDAPLVRFPGYLGDEGHGGGEHGTPDTHNYWWIRPDDLELLPFQAGDEVVSIDQYDRLGERGVILRNDFTGVMPYEVSFYGDEYVSYYDAEDLRLVDEIDIQDEIAEVEELMDTPESNHFVVVGDDPEMICTYDTLEEAIEEADLAARDLPNETFFVFKKLYEVRRTEVTETYTTSASFK